jgi:hypothetical protein
VLLGANELCLKLGQPSVEFGDESRACRFCPSWGAEMVMLLHAGGGVRIWEAI